MQVQLVRRRDLQAPLTAAGLADRTGGGRDALARGSARALWITRSPRAAGAERPAGLVERRLAELGAGRSVAELLAAVLAVAGAQHVAQVGLELERVAVLPGVALRLSLIHI